MIGKIIKTKYFLYLSIILLILTLMPMILLAQPSDINGHWAEKQLSDWVNKDLAKGYEDGKFKPDSNITRAEFIALVNRAYGFKETIEAGFSDVKSNDWFAGEIGKAIAAGYVSGYQDGTIKPNNQITRQEVATILTRLLKLDTSSNSELVDNFKDTKSIPQWSKSAIGAVVSSGYMKGYTDQTFKPIRPITRAEAIVSLDRALGQATTITMKSVTLDQAGTYGPATGMETNSGNVTISVPNVTLQNTVITGDLLLAEGIGNGDVKLKNVKVNGNTIIKGGGANSITLEDCSLPNITVSKEGVRVVSLGNTTVKVVHLESGATLVEVTTTGPGFETVTLSEVIPADAKITLTGNFEAVNVVAKEVKVEVVAGKVETLEVAKEATGATVNIAKEAVVNTLTANAAAKVTGEGKVETAKVNAANVSITQTPTKTEVASGVTSNVGGQTVSGRTTTSSGGGSSSSDSVVAATYAVTVSANPVAGGTLNGGGNYTQGASVTVTATANPGYKFVNWTESGTQVSINASYVFTMGTAGRTLVANFTEDTEANPGPFTPGEGGSLPAFTPFNNITGKIGGLYIDRSHRVNEIFIFNGVVDNYPVVDLAFYPPNKYGATSYTLQSSNDNGSTWSDTSTTSNDSQDNFSISSPAGSSKYRLLVNGGTYDGYTSNEVDAQISTVPTRYTGWGLDESMWISGVISPFVGSGKQASFSVEKLPDHDNTVLNVYLDYQWYRVNPSTFEMTTISGATDLTYLTTEADAGYLLLCRATGDGINVGGIIQILSHWSPVIPNETYVNNATHEGFTLNLYKSIVGLSPEDLKLSYFDDNGNEVIIPITSITPRENNAVFDVIANIPQSVSQLELNSSSTFWQIVTVMGEGHMMRQGVNITFE